MVAPGKLADLLLLEGDPTTSIDVLRKLSLVIQNGSIVVDNAHMDWRFLLPKGQSSE